MHRFAILLLALSSFVFSEALPGWQGYDDKNPQAVDHQLWQDFLDDYLMFDVYGQSFFDYKNVSETQKENLRIYLFDLQKINPLTLSKNEQKAFWINLYNSVTVDIVLQHFPVKSIRNIGGAFGGLIPSGPWGLKVLTVNGHKLSLDDIEHGIFRPKFKDYRIHYALNCASKGCPNLSKVVFTGSNVEQLLVDAEKTFINHLRGVRIQRGKLVVSKIFKWYLTDFVNEEDQLARFLSNVAEPKLKAQIKNYSGRISYEYDWALNEAKLN